MIKVNAMEERRLHIGRAANVAEPKDRRFYRAFEIMPGLLAWLTLLMIIGLSFVAPVFMAIFIIVFDVYWLIKTVYLSLHLRESYKRMRANMKVNWLEKLEGLSAVDYRPPTIKSWRDVYHLIFLPVYREEYSVIAASVESLLKTNYPKSRLAVILCYEERGGENTARAVREIAQNYKKDFFELLAVKHPDGLSGEIPGKGSNAAYAAKIVKEELIDRLGIPYSHILVSNFDIDTVLFPEYFGVLTYTFLTSANPLRASYQPVPLYVNNIWEAPSFARVVAFSATFWHTIKQEKWENATTFSSHSMPFQALLDAGFWQTNMVSEDSRIFWQCFLRYEGDYRVVPLFYPVSMDANVAPGVFETFKNVYKQQRRWGYGVENIPYFLFGFWKNKAIPKLKKFYFGFTVIEGFHSWATNAIIIFILGWLPALVGGPAFNKTVLSFNLPHITRIIMIFAMLGLVSSAVLSIFLLPPRPPKFGRFKYLWMVLQWLLFPAATIIFGALPGLDAQTRLMFGKYMGFWATPKYRRSPKTE